MTQKSLTLADLAARRCRDLPAGTPALAPGDVQALLAALPEWRRAGDAIARTYRFDNFHETMSFVNAVAHVANTENHHPDLAVTYSGCTVTFSTHSVGGLSDNDFIAAAKVEALPR